MVVRRERKSRKLRGRSRTMGWGSVGQHRKSGSRGGKGAAGLGKHEWTWTIKYAPDWYGKRGFTPRRSKAGYHKTVVNVGDLAEIVDRLKSTGKAKMEDGMVEVNLADMGVEKLLGEGEIMVPVKVIVSEASETAVKKIEEAGGKVILLTKAQS
ncbi:MAG: 50S ribosomal protein L15 [Desulfurococcaceae archaeon]|jgi:large subunit ribosomal protein L15|nr:50S ribosomal protein L15 [Desulfurococcaceae archaeon]MCC6060551.1 50S ribosomal protein L15 [Desulfurococcaceae archaeon]